MKHTGEQTKTLYMIRNTEGLFSSGGQRPTFSRRGKVWDTAGKVRSHLNGYITQGAYEKRKIPGDWNVVGVEYKATNSKTYSAASFYEQRRKKA